MRTRKCYKRNLLFLILSSIACLLLFIYCNNDSLLQVENTSIVSRILNDQTLDINRGNQSRNHRQVSHSNPWRQRFPHIFIIGFGKTGTRGLYNTLLMHSKVVGPYQEMRFFDEHYHFGLTWYINQMPHPARGSQIVAEKSPCYILNQLVPARLIKAAKLFNVTLKELKFVVMLRHPIVRAISEYLEWQSLRAKHNGEVLASFDELALDKNGAANVKDFQPLNHSLYVYYIRQWLQIFSHDQFCFVNGEMFAEQPYQVISKLEKCLKLPPEISRDNFVWEEKRRLHCLSHNGTVMCPSMSKGRPHPFVEQDIVDVLMKYFKPFNEELYTITGENYGWEKYYKGLNVF